MSVISNSRVPVVAFLDDPIDSVQYLKQSTGSSFIEALRSQTAAATVSPALFKSRNTLIIHPSIEKPGFI